MNNANRQKLMNLTKELRQLNSVLTSLRLKKDELRYKKNKTRANETTLRHVRNMVNKIAAKQLSTRREEIRLRERVWQNTHPGQNYNWFLFSKWFKQNQKKYQARTALSLTNLPLNMRRLIVSKIK